MRYTGLHVGMDVLLMKTDLDDDDDDGDDDDGSLGTISQ